MHEHMYMCVCMCMYVCIPVYPIATKDIPFCSSCCLAVKDGDATRIHPNTSKPSALHFAPVKLVPNTITLKPDMYVCMSICMYEHMYV